MRTTFKLLFFVKRNAAKKNGNAPIIARITIDQIVAQFNTQMEINPANWSVSAGKATGRSAEAMSINSMLDSIRSTVHQHYHGSPRKVVEKAKNNYFCSMETGYELFLPEGILTYFEVTHADRTATAILIYLDEKDLSEEERSGKHLQSKGFYPPASIHDFPLRGKSLILHVRRRRWVDLDTGNPYMRAWEVVAKGTRLTEEFASFLKGTLG